MEFRFGWFETEAEKEARISTSNYFIEQKRKQELSEEIEVFKSYFKNDKPWNQCPRKWHLHKIFPEKNIDELNLLELVRLGFHSDLVSRRDLQKRSVIEWKKASQ